MRFLSLLFIVIFALFSASANARTGADRADSIYNGTEYVSPDTYEVATVQAPRRAHTRKRQRHRDQDEVVRQKPVPAITAEQAIAMEDISKLPVLTRIATAIDNTVSKIERAFQFYLNKGYRHIEVAGMLGHFRAESNFNTRDTGDGGKARYLAQWWPDRQQGLKKLARNTNRDVYDYDVNLEYVDVELRESETLVLRKLKEAQDIDDATAAFAHFERPFGYRTNCPRCTHDYKLRLHFAYQYYNEFKHLQPQQEQAGI